MISNHKLYFKRC